MKRTQNQENAGVAGEGTELPVEANAGAVSAVVAEAATGEAPASPDVPAAPAVAAEKLTPAKWAERKGIAPTANPAHPWVEPIAKSTKDCPLGVHLHSADVLHGWSHHAYQYQAEKDAFLIEEKDFDDALKAAAEFPALPAHAPAVTPSCPFKGEHDARAEAAAKATAEAKDKPE